MTKPGLNYIKAPLMLHFVCMRVSLRDNEGEDVGRDF